jgi:hypothetical protein
MEITMMQNAACRRTALIALLSGLIGIIGYGFLIGFLVSRSENGDTWLLMSRLHDVACAFQFLLLIPVISGVYKLLRQNDPQAKRMIFIIGAVAALTTSICLLLVFSRLVSEILYMIPQGIFGTSLIVINLQKYEFISLGLRIFGVIVGIGLLLTGVFPFGFAFLVSMDVLRIPAAPMREYPQTNANNLLHILLVIGSFMGVITLPFWTILLGKYLLK